MLTKWGGKSYKSMHYAIIEEEVFDVENHIELERAQGLMAELELDEVQVWSSTRTREEIEKRGSTFDVPLFTLKKLENKWGE